MYTVETMGMENFQQPNQVELIDVSGQPTLEALSDDELAALYKEHVGVLYRKDLTRSALIAVLRADAEEELARLREIDTASDKEHLNPRGN